MKLVHVLVALSALSASAAMAGGKRHSGTPNCEVKGKKVHMKSEKACAKKKGTWLAKAAEEAAPAEAAHDDVMHEDAAPAAE